MTRKIHFIAAAALALGGMSFTTASAAQNSGQESGQKSAQNQQSQQEQSQSQQRQGNGQIVTEDIVIYGVLEPANSQQITPGFGRTEMRERSSVLDALSKVAESTLQKKNGLSNLLQCVEKKDRQRLEQAFSKSDSQKLDGAIAQFQKAWLQRFNKDFDASSQVASFSHLFTIYAGEITNPTMLSDWPVKQDQGQQGQNQQGQNQQAQHQQKGQQGQQEKEAAVVVFPAKQGLPQTYVSLLKEDGAWKIDLPDSVDPQQVHDSLVQAIEHLSQKPDQFPDDQNQAYQHVTHAILMSLYGEQPGQHGQQENQGQQNGGQNGNQNGNQNGGQK
jgi:hypothetical protein